ncbi:unnamed protein product [Arabidopsis lyrata]|nr:unnamed protein product [Arabidopsis lyrata]
MHEQGFLHWKQPTGYSWLVRTKRREILSQICHVAYAPRPEYTAASAGSATTTAEQQATLNRSHGLPVVVDKLASRCKLDLFELGPTCQTKKASIGMKTACLESLPSLPNEPTSVRCQDGTLPGVSPIPVNRAETDRSLRAEENNHRNEVKMDKEGKGMQADVLLGLRLPSFPSFNWDKAYRTYKIGQKREDRSITEDRVHPLQFLSMAIVQAEKRQEIYFTGNLQVATVGWSK